MDVQNHEETKSTKKTVKAIGLKKSFVFLVFFVSSRFVPIFAVPIQAGSRPFSGNAMFGWNRRHCSLRHG
jgi:hypothetical protein